MTSAVEVEGDAPTHCLELIRGPDAGRRFWIGPQGAVIGRTPPADIVLADSEVSRSHCRLTVQEGELLVADLKSTNGTYLDDKRLEEPVLMPVGGVLRIGRQLLRLLDPNAKQGVLAAPDIFLSYNRQDQARARVFAQAFESMGFEVWWDVDLRAGEAYDEVTESALRTAKAVVVLWSTRSVASRWVRAEATLADRAGTLLPAMIEVCERPVMFELVQTADLSHWNGDVEDPAWQAFVLEVRGRVGQGGAEDETAASDSPDAE